MVFDQFYFTNKNAVVGWIPQKSATRGREMTLRVYHREYRISRSLHPTLHTGSLHATASITNTLLHFSYFPPVV